MRTLWCWVKNINYFFFQGVYDFVSVKLNLKHDFNDKNFEIHLPTEVQNKHLHYLFNLNNLLFKYFFLMRHGCHVIRKTYNIKTHLLTGKEKLKIFILKLAWLIWGIIQMHTNSVVTMMKYMLLLTVFLQ